MVFFFMNWIFVCGRILFFFEIMLISYIGLKNDVNLMSKIENILVIYCWGKYVYNKMLVKLMLVVFEDCKVLFDKIFLDIFVY